MRRPDWHLAKRFYDESAAAAEAIAGAHHAAVASGGQKRGRAVTPLDRAFGGMLTSHPAALPARSSSAWL